MRPYTIRDGCAFVLDGRRMTGGERIQLEDDVAQAHAEKLEPIKPEDAEFLEAAAAQAEADAAAAAKAQTDQFEADRAAELGQAGQAPAADA